VIPLNSPKSFAAFETFMSANLESPPVHVSRAVQTLIHEKLNPSFPQIAWRVLLLQVLSMGFLLMICPHFGIQWIPGFTGLPSLYMRAGHGVCMFLCGATMLGPSLWITIKLLPSEFVKPLVRRPYVLLLILSFSSIGVLGYLGGDILWLSDGPTWILGSLVSGWASLMFKRRQLKQAEPYLAG
jgi:hypothetical protein